MSMIKTMAEDRRKAKLAQGEVDLAKAKAELLDAENTKLRAEIRLRETELRVLNDRIGEKDSSDRQESKPR